MGPRLAVLAAALLGTCAPAHAAVYPAVEVLAAFADGCDRPLDSLDPPAPHPRGTRWETISPAAESDLGRLLAAQGADQARAFRATVAGRELFLVLSERAGEAQRRGMTCHVVDFAGSEPIAQVLLVPWAGRHPDGQIGDYGAPRWGSYWEPGLFEGHGRTEIFYVPAVGPPGTTEPLRGIVLATSTSGTIN